MYSFQKQSQTTSYSSSSLHPNNRIQKKEKGSFSKKSQNSRGIGLQNFSKLSILPPSNIPIQPKLKINAPNDKYEQEADKVAEQVVRMPESTVQQQGTKYEKEADSIQRKPLSKGLSTIPSFLSISPIQRQCSKCKEEEQVLQSKATGNTIGQATPSLNSQINNTKGQGQAMNQNTLSFMESRIGVDFSKVRIHTGHQAAEMNRGINAKAFTIGRDIYFNRGMYKPNTEEGKRLLSHELVHTIQQGNDQGTNTIQREGEDEKKKSGVKAEVEVVNETDFSNGTNESKSETSLSAEKEITKGVTAKASTKTTKENTTVTPELKAKKATKDKKTEVFGAGGMKAKFETDPTVANSSTWFLKVGGKHKFFDKTFSLEGSGKGEFASHKKPKWSFDGKAIFIPNKTFSAELAAKLVLGSKGTSGSIEPGVVLKVMDDLSFKAGVPIEVGTDGNVVVKGKVGFVLSF